MEFLGNPESKETIRFIKMFEELRLMCSNFSLGTRVKPDDGPALKDPYWA